MTHSVVIWLCQRHRHPEFLRRHGGQALTRRLATAWAAHGVTTVNRARALDAHHHRVTTKVTERWRPGSYAWPRLRRDAEARFAAGEHVRVVIRELRERHANDYATMPSIRTMRRWFAEGRWLADAPRRSSKRRSPPPEPDRPRRIGWRPPPSLVVEDPFWPFSMLFNGPRRE